MWKRADFGEISRKERNKYVDPDLRTDTRKTLRKSARGRREFVRTLWIREYHAYSCLVNFENRSVAATIPNYPRLKIEGQHDIPVDISR